MRLLVTGGCGYVGSVLVPKLLAAGHDVLVVDTQWFGNYLKPHNNLGIHRMHFGDLRQLPLWDAIIHLAAIANDPTGDLNPKLTWETNALWTMRLAELASKEGVKQFIYASSGSVYGVSSLPRVTEDAPLDPISEYNKTKMVAERCLLSYADKMAVQIIRPATVCGYSPRMRLDVMVNALTMDALQSGVIEIRGGAQMRPNLHIEDMTDLYLWMLDRPHLTGIWNASNENLSTLVIAKLVQNQVPCEIRQVPSNDPRSYRMDSTKLKLAGWSPALTVEHAISDIAHKFKKGELVDNVNWHSLLAMRARGIR
jgi:nucleoside-diphosphate-sugar epimerase